MSGNKKFPRTHAGRLAADMVLRYYTHDVARDSAALTYYLLFAIFPLLIFISTLLGLLELDVAYITSVLEPLLPADVVDVVRSYLEYVSANQSRQLLWFSLIFSIWFPMRASGCLMHSLRKAFGRSAPGELVAQPAADPAVHCMADRRYRRDAGAGGGGTVRAGVCRTVHHHHRLVHHRVEFPALRAAGGGHDYHAGDPVYALPGPAPAAAGGAAGVGGHWRRGWC